MEIDPLERAIRTYLLAVIVPLWIGAGSADYLLHRRSHIEATAGVNESLLHITGISLAAVPVMAGLYLEVNAGVIGLMIAGFAAHAGMSVCDVALASKTRLIVPAEQHIHGLLELVPFCALSFVLCIHHEQALALAGFGNAKPRFRIARKPVPLPAHAVAATIAAFGALVAVPYIEELVRCIRFARRRHEEPR